MDIHITVHVRTVRVLHEGRALVVTLAEWQSFRGTGTGAAYAQKHAARRISRVQTRHQHSEYCGAVHSTIIKVSEFDTLRPLVHR